jgi:hypothetical protein
MDIYCGWFNLKSDVQENPGLAQDPVQAAPGDIREAEIRSETT